MLVKIEYKNRRMEVVGSDLFDFDTYCLKLSQDAIGILSDLELCCGQEGGEMGEAYRRLRHRVFDLSGALRRLPGNLLDEKGARGEKPTHEGIVSAIKG